MLSRFNLEGNGSRGGLQFKVSVLMFGSVTWPAQLLGFDKLSIWMRNIAESSSLHLSYTLIKLVRDAVRKQFLWSRDL